MTETANAPDDYEFTTLGPDAQEYEAYAMVTLDAGQVLLYDVDDEDAWIQSDTAVSLPDNG